MIILEHLMAQACMSLLTEEACHCLQKSMSLLTEEGGAFFMVARNQASAACSEVEGHHQMNLTQTPKRSYMTVIRSM